MRREKEPPLGPQGPLSTIDDFDDARRGATQRATAKVLTVDRDILKGSEYFLNLGALGIISEQAFYLEELDIVGPRAVPTSSNIMPRSARCDRTN